MQNPSDTSNAPATRTQIVSGLESTAYTQNVSDSAKACSFIPELAAASGRLDFPLTNDYLFRAVFQENNSALKGLISSLLHIPPMEISSVVITNPIILGAALGDKEIRLDINVMLNHQRLINLEMQVTYQTDWHDRSLVYLCRNVDDLLSGDDYTDLMPVVHIGILDSPPAGEGTEFYSKHMLMNVKTGKIYNDKIVLCMLNLSQSKNAAKEDKVWGIDRWARLLKARTWEEIKMTAENNEYLTQASNTLFLMSADAMARKRAQDREDYYRDLCRWKRQLAEKDAVITQQQSALDKERLISAQKDALIADLKAQLTALQSE